MILKYYHAEPVANSLKSMIPLIEKGLVYESVYVDLHKFEQHSDRFVAINPEGQVPVLDHDGTIITHTTVINEYLEDVFPDIPLRPPYHPFPYQDRPPKLCDEISTGFSPTFSPAAPAISLAFSVAAFTARARAWSRYLRNSVVSKLTP